MSGLPPTAEHLRAEVARHGIRRKALSDVIDMHVNQISALLNEDRALAPWSAHNLAWGINTLTGLKIFNVDMSRGILPPTRGPGHGTMFGGLRLPVKPLPVPYRHWLYKKTGG